MPKAKTIVKVQRPLDGERHDRMSGAVLHLVYDKKRKFTHEQGVPAPARRALGNDPKGYFEATRERGYGAWLIGNRIEDQDW